MGYLSGLRKVPVWSDYPKLKDKEELLRMLKKGYTFEEISWIVGCSKKSVATAVKHHGIRFPLVSVGAELKKRLDLK